MTSECKFCNGAFQIDIENGLVDFCSRECRDESKSHLLSSSKRRCITCDKLFNNRGDEVACSKNCYDIYLRHNGIFNKIREYPEKFFIKLQTDILSNSKVVNKGWGFEVHVINHSDYCLKYLVFEKNKRFSLHYHNLKRELWHILIGKFHCILKNNKGMEESFDLVSPNKIEIQRGIQHQLIAKDYSIITEVSTKDFPEDSIRLIKGD